MIVVYYTCAGCGATREKVLCPRQARGQSDKDHTLLCSSLVGVRHDLLSPGCGGPMNFWWEGEIVGQKKMVTHGGSIKGES